MAKTYKLPDGTVLDYQAAVKLYKAMEREFAKIEIDEFADDSYFFDFPDESWDAILNSYLDRVDRNQEIKKIKGYIGTGELKNALVKQIQTPAGMMNFLDQLKDTDGISFIRTIGGTPEMLVLNDDFSLISGKFFTVGDFKPMVQAMLEQGVEQLTYSGKPISGIAVADNLILLTVKK